jgi:hypothetical protein
VNRSWAILFCCAAIALIVLAVDDYRHAHPQTPNATPTPVAVATTAAPAPTPTPVAHPTTHPTSSPTTVPKISAACASSLAALSASPSSAAGLMPNLTNGALTQAIFDHNQLSYVLATAEWETGHFATMYEYYNSADDLNQAYDGEIGNGVYPSNDGFTYRGRGYVQLTGRANYSQMGSLLGLDLVDNPDQAADPFIAGEIAAIGMHKGLFTGVSLGNYISNPTIDFVGARAIVNDHDQADTIAAYATHFSSTLAACGGSVLK